MCTGSPTGVGSRQRMFTVLWSLECPVGLTQKEFVRISVKEIWHNFDSLLKGKTGSYGMFWN